MRSSLVHPQPFLVYSPRYCVLPFSCGVDSVPTPEHSTVSSFKQCVGSSAMRVSTLDRHRDDVEAEAAPDGPPGGAAHHTPHRDCAPPTHLGISTAEPASQTEPNKKVRVGMSRDKIIKEITSYAMFQGSDDADIVLAQIFSLPDLKDEFLSCVEGLYLEPSLGLAAATNQHPLDDVDMAYWRLRVQTVRRTTTSLSSGLASSGSGLAAPPPV
eukprot:9492991-Pyramimonas_sp.AAC.1